MAIHIHTNYYQDNLERVNCLNCDRDFIVGEDLSKEIDICCPYCSSDNVDIEAYTDEENLERMQLGCLGIYYFKEGDTNE